MFQMGGFHRRKAKTNWLRAYCHHHKERMNRMDAHRRVTRTNRLRARLCLVRKDAGRPVNSNSTFRRSARPRPANCCLRATRGC
jgi:hypothetical protein